MGTCYSTIGGRRGTDQKVEDWWKCKDDRSEKKPSLGSKFKRSWSAGDLSSFIGKFGGGRGAAAAEERQLLQVPGKLFGNGSTSIASLYTQQGKKGTNQDTMIFWENFSSRSDTVFCGVFDGHGPHGHLVARKVRDCLPILLCSQWNANSETCQIENGHVTDSKDSGKCLDDYWCEYLEVEENEKVPETYRPLEQSILEAFKLMDKELKFHQTIDCFCSGTTAVTLVKQGRHIIIGNVGDSRAVLATRDEDNALTAIQLTVDLKPNLPREAARIHQCKGRVFALQDEPEVPRVWLPNSNSPGLAMARAFGDFCLKDFGLISVPDVYYRHLTDKDEFIVLATDGVWDVLSNKEAIDIIVSAPSRATAARALVECATRTWRLKYPTSKTDDCAAVCLFLEHVPAGSEEAAKRVDVMNRASNASGVEHFLGPSEEASEIVPIVESREECLGASKRSLAECLLTSEDDEWSALEGITRVNSLLSLPRFLSKR